MHSKLIHTTLPLNITQADTAFFENGAAYIPEQTTVFDLKDKLVTYSGIVFSWLKIESASVYAYKDRQRKYQLAALFNLLFRKKLRLPADETYLVVHGPYCPGYYHWITEALPRIMAVQQKLPELTLLLPETYPQYVTDSLSPFHFKRIQRVPPKLCAIVPRLQLPSHPKYGDSFNSRAIAQMRQWYTQANQTASPTACKRIYISRKQAGKRKIANEAALLPVLELFGYETLCWEDLNFWQQVAVMQQAESLVSIHGAGLCNLLFMPAGSAVLELYKKPDENEYHNKSYWRLAAAAGLRYYYLFCEPVNSGEPLDTAGIEVDVVKLRKVLATL